MKSITIRDIRTILTAPREVELVVVKVETDEPELYGLGCATFTQRYEAVHIAIERYLKPLLIGRSVHEIEDAWQIGYNSSYWRNGPVLNNALSGVDQALWDIKGKLAGMPVYELLGGKSRQGAAVYGHADGRDLKEVEDNVARLQEMGYRYIRIQHGFYGGNSAGAKQSFVKPLNSPAGAYYDPAQYMRSVVKLFEGIRLKFGWELELCHDIHERLSPINALQLAKDLERFKLYFLEDALAPDQVHWFEFIRKQTSVPLAMGELFNNPMEWKDIIANRYIDFIRVHLSQIGGLTPAIKLAHFCDAFGVRTAWHGPSDLAPVGAMAQLHLDVNVNNFGVQECNGFTDEEREVFPGCPTIVDGYMYPNDKPGFGIDIDEKAASRYPCKYDEHFWARTRIVDGTAVHP